MRNYQLVAHSGLALALLGLAGCDSSAHDVRTGRQHLAVAGLPESICVTIGRGASGDIADTQIAENRRDENFGRMPVANAGQSGGGERQTLLRADLGEIPAGVSVESATLTLWQSNTGSGVVNAHRVLTPWNGTTVTWNSLNGAFASEVAASVDNGGPAYEGPISLDLTELVQAWVKDVSTNHGVLLSQAGHSATRFRTGKVGNVAHRPRLEVCYRETRLPEGTSLLVQVVDTAGAPIASAAVTTGSEVLATDGAGRLLLEDLMPGRVVARVEARGYAPASAVVDLTVGAHAGTEVRLHPLGPPMPFDADTGAVLERGPVRVSIPAGVLLDYRGEPVTGTVEATIVPLDPTQTNPANLPGPLDSAVTESGAAVSLESLAMADVSLWQDGLPVQLRPGARATIELEIPDALAVQHRPGDTIPAWWLDVEAGVWREEGTGTLEVSSTDPEKLVWVARVGHFTWWNSDKPWDQKSCFEVTVVYEDDLTAVPNVMVGVQGSSYPGSSTPQYTQDDGSACVEGMLAGKVYIVVGSYDDPLAISPEQQGSFLPSDCAGNGVESCTPVTITIPSNSIICTPGESLDCAYGGEPGTQDVGVCRAGSNTCSVDGTSWSGCTGEVTPGTETCATIFDDDCDGTANEPDDGVGCECGSGDTQVCYGGPPDTLGVGMCMAGTSTCDVSIGRFGPCMGDVVPQPETCETSGDDNCDGSTVCEGVASWSRLMGQSGGEEDHDNAVDAAGNVIYTGALAGTVDLGGDLFSSAGSDIYLAKFDKHGNHLWSQRFGDSNAQLPSQLAVDSAGNILVTGYFYGNVDFGGGLLTSAGGADVFVAKFDPDGNHLWSKRFGEANAQFGWEVAVDAMGNVLIGGSFSGTLDMGGGALTGWNEMFVAKFDSAGNHLWSKRFGGSMVLNGMTMDSAGNALLMGWFTTQVNFGGGPLVSAGWADVFVAKLDPDGNHLWSKRFGDGAGQFGRAIAVDRRDHVILNGQVSGSIDLGGGPLASVGSYDVFVAKLDPDGNHLWSKRFGDANVQRTLDVTADGAANIILTGLFAGSIDFGGGPLASAASQDMFVAKLNPDGQHVWSRAFGGAMDQAGLDIITDHMDHILVTGTFTGSIDLGAGALSSAAGSSVFLARFNP
jgi:hypothetical protein